MLTALGKKGDFKDGVLKVNIPRSDLRVTIAGRSGADAVRIRRLGRADEGHGRRRSADGRSRADARTKSIPVMSALLDNGLDVTALHNHFFWEQPRIFYMHVHGMGARGRSGAQGEAGGRADRRSAASKRDRAPAARSAARPLSRRSNGAALAKIIGHQGEQNGPVYKITIGRPDIDLREHGAASTRAWA